MYFLLNMVDFPGFVMLVFRGGTWTSQEVRIKGDRISGSYNPKDYPIYK